jgi:DeoR/GlpR family transcriptional regulator of sugar metabolism
MTFIEQLEALERLHELIRRKGTGTPEQLAERFKVSVGTIHNLIKILRNKGLPVLYCRDRQTYYYEYEVDVFLFVVKAKEDSNKIRGGENIFNYFSPMQNFCIDASHLCNKLINNEEGNDAGGFRYLGFGY